MIKKSTSTPQPQSPSPPLRQPPSSRPQTPPPPQSPAHPHQAPSNSHASHAHHAWRWNGDSMIQGARRSWRRRWRYCCCGDDPSWTQPVAEGRTARPRPRSLLPLRLHRRGRRRRLRRSCHRRVRGCVCVYFLISLKTPQERTEKYSLRKIITPRKRLPTNPTNIRPFLRMRPHMPLKML